MLVAFTTTYGYDAQSGAKSASFRDRTDFDRELCPIENDAVTAPRYATARRFSQRVHRTQRWTPRTSCSTKVTELRNRLKSLTETAVSCSVASLTAQAINDGELRAGLERTWQQF